MSKETIKMQQIRLTRIGLKEVLKMAEQTANSHRRTIRKNWDKENDKEARRALYKAHKGLVKARVVINECQRQLLTTKREIRKLNHQHDIHIKAVALAKEALSN